MHASTKQQHIIISCYMKSKCMICDIKFNTMKPTFMLWMKEEKIFIESNSLSIAKTRKVGYLANLHPTLMNCTNLKQLLHSALDDIVIDPQLAVELNPELKTLQTEVMTNGDLFIPNIPPFELYKTKITTGRDKEKVKTNVIGIKCTADKAKLMKEFYSQLASLAHYEKQIGIFVPIGAVHLLGVPNYAKLIRDNNSFLQSITTIPISDFQYATLDIPFPSINLQILTRQPSVNLFVTFCGALASRKPQPQTKFL